MNIAKRLGKYAVVISTSILCFVISIDRASAAKKHNISDVFVRDYLPDGCVAWAVPDASEVTGVHDVYRTNNKRLFEHYPCGIVTGNAHSYTLGDKIISDDDGDHKSYIYI